MWLTHSHDYLLLARDAHAHRRPHRHHALQWSLAMGDPLHCQVGGRSFRSVSVVVNADVPHAVNGRGLYFHCEPESDTGRKLRTLLAGQPCMELPHLSADPLLRLAAGQFVKGCEPDPLRLDEGLQEALSGVLRATPAFSLDDRVESTLEVLQAAPGTRLSLPELADRVALSPTRLRHLFVAEVGLPIRSYVVWLRLTESLRHMVAGAQLTQTAHAIGFPDQAGFSRAFVRTFGHAPSAGAQTPAFAHLPSRPVIAEAEEAREGGPIGDALPFRRRPPT